jgi:hypothetical protein
VLWYRHWLELRSNALTLIGAAAVLGPVYFRRELFEPRPFRAGFMSEPLLPLITSFDALQVSALQRHLEFMWFAILFVSMMIAGDGLRIFTNQFGRTGLVTTPAQYSLSLPVSRRRIVMTRLAAGYALAALVLMVSLMANAAALLAFDRAVPIVPMLLATAFATVVILFWTCVIVTMLVIAGPGWGMSLSVIGMLFGSPVAVYGMSSAAARTLEWPLVVLFGVILAFTIYVSLEIATGEEV